MNEPIERHVPPLRPSRRPRRFVLPADHHDARTSERIEAFIEGPSKPARKRARTGVRRPHRPIVLETALEWRAALRREEVRIERYGRSASVMVVDVAYPGLEAEQGSVPAELQEPLTDAIRREARETDHVLRTSPTRFLLLLPETGETDAEQLADRLRSACRGRLDGHRGVIRLRVESATPGHGRSLADAVAEVERRLAD